MENNGQYNEWLDFQFIGNRIAKYYKEVFDIEIIQLFHKSNKKKQEKKNIGEVEFDFLTNSTFDFYVLIKDNKRFAIKHKLIKITYNEAIFESQGSQNLTFMEKLYTAVDLALYKYCVKRYRWKEQEIPADVIEKHYKITEDYHKYLKTIQK